MAAILSMQMTLSSFKIFLHWCWGWGWQWHRTVLRIGTEVKEPFLTCCTTPEILLALRPMVRAFKISNTAFYQTQKCLQPHNQSVEAQNQALVFRVCESVHVCLLLQNVFDSNWLMHIMVAVVYTVFSAQWLCQELCGSNVIILLNADLLNMQLTL